MWPSPLYFCGYFITDQAVVWHAAQINFSLWLSWWEEFKVYENILSHSFFIFYSIFQRIYCVMTSIIFLRLRVWRFRIWFCSVWLTVLLTSRGGLQGQRQTVLTHTTPLCCSTSESCSNPTIYHYNWYRLNTRPGEGMIERESVCVSAYSVHAPKHPFFFGDQSSGVNVCTYACVGLLARLALCLCSPCAFVLNNSMCACTQACVYADIMQNSLASHPNLKKKVTGRRPLWNTRCSFGKSRQLGCLHFSDWEGKKTRCPLELLSSGHTEISHIAMGDRPVSVCVGGVEGYREHWGKSLNTLWWLAAGGHDIMQQCWKLATLVKFVCLNSAHFLTPQTTLTHTYTHLSSTHTLTYCSFLCLALLLSSLLPNSLSLQPLNSSSIVLSIVATLFANSSSTSLSVKKTLGQYVILGDPQTHVCRRIWNRRAACPCWYCRHFYCFIMSTINLPAGNSLCLYKTLPVNFFHSTCS